MPNAIKKTVEVEVKTVVKKEVIELQLSEKEAKVLMLIVGSVVGCPYNSYRGVSDVIHQALRDCGVRIDLHMQKFVDQNLAFKDGFYPMCIPD